MSKKRNEYKVLVGNVKERDHLQESGIDGRIILKRISMKQDWRVWAGFIWLR
jgi:hypothetical protein